MTVTVVLQIHVQRVVARGETGAATPTSTRLDDDDDDAKQSYKRNATNHCPTKHTQAKM